MTEREKEIRSLLVLMQIHHKLGWHEDVKKGIEHAIALLDGVAARG